MDQILKVFKENFKSEPVLIQAPGRINLIGEHTDYNDGYVMPAAINRFVYFAMAPNKSKKARIISIDFKEKIEVNTKRLKESEKSWANYLLGVLDLMQQKSNSIFGIDCVLAGDIPIGAGLSSSAALESGFAYGLNYLYKLKLKNIELVKIAQKAEHLWAGVNCGIMDQFTSIFGRQNQVIQLDCRTLQYKYFPLNLNDFTILLCDTRVKHSLANSEYNKRREECDLGVTALKQFEPQLVTLRDLDLKTLNKYKSKLDDTIFKRCDYVVEENKRVFEAGIALQSGDFESLGKLLYMSHAGLKDKYEVSCIELDFLVEIAKKAKGVYGARMMGGGFGGCTINIVESKSAEEFSENLKFKYKSRFKKEPYIYQLETVVGTKIIN